MAINSFEQLIQGVYQHLDIEIPEMADDEPIHGLEFDHHGMEVKMVETSEAPDARSLVFCNFGSLPAEQELDGLRKLMEINLFLGNEGNTLFGRDPDSGEINFRFEQTLAGTTIESFVESLDQIASQAAEWRTDYFLGDDDESGDAEFSAFKFA